MRKYNISATVILQDISQIEAMYDKEWKTIVGNCSSIVFLGSQEPNTLKYFSEMLGKRTVKNKGRGTSNGKSKGSNESFQNTGRELRTPDELGRMSPKKCIVFTQNMRPVEDFKYKYENHPRYQMTADYDNNKGFQFKNMAIYDNNRFSINHLLKAKSESARIAKERDVTNPDTVKGKYIDGSKDDILNRCYFDPKKEEMGYLERVTQCRKELELKAHHEVAFVDVGVVPSRKLIALAKQQTDYRHPFVLFSDLNEKDHMMIGIGYDPWGKLYSVMKHPLAKNHEIIDNLCMVRINCNRVEEYKDAIIEHMKG